MTNRTVTLHHRDDLLGSQYLGASISDDGTLTIEGQEIGDSVERFFGTGYHEYEWTWTIESKDIAQLKSALDSVDDVLVALAKRFSNDAAVELQPFLDKHGIPYECWSRIGD